MNYLENFTQKITDSGIEEEPAIVQYCKVLAAMIPAAYLYWIWFKSDFAISSRTIFFCAAIPWKRR